MKTILAGICSLLFAIQAFAIEGIQVNVPSTNAILSWPSVDDGSETYLIQYRHTLNDGDTWNTLADFYPPDEDTNITVFIDTNLVNFGSVSGGSGGGGGVPMPGNTNSAGGSPSTNSTGMGFYRVVRDGVHLWGITNGMIVHDVLITPIEYAVGSTDQVTGVSFYDGNGNPIIGASAQQISNTGFTLVWNTTLSFNGDYDVYAELNFASDDSVESVPVSVTVNNAIAFPNYFSQVYGDQMWIYAQTTPDVAYSIDMYDENTNYLGTFSDYSDDSGIISFLWDLTDSNGDTLDSTNFTGVFTVDTSSSAALTKAKIAPAGLSSLNKTPSGKRKFASTTKSTGINHKSGSGSTAQQFWVKEGKWTPNDNWVVAQASLTGNSSIDQKASYMIVGGQASPTDDYGILGTLDAYGLHGNLSPGNNAQGGNVFLLSDKSSRTNLLNYLASSRYENFYYFGHGNDVGISSYNAATTGITTSQMAYDLGNVPLSYQIQHAAQHPYRFVWIDACETGKGTFCEAFGIPAYTVSTNFFASAGVESRAYLGFTKDLSFDPSNSSADPTGWQNRSIMMATFLNEWLGNIDLQTIVGGAENSFGQGGYKMDSSAIIYGAYDLKRFTHTRTP